MNEIRIRKLLAGGESVQVEFKTCKDALNKDIYETVCAFLNRAGGELLLGVNDKGVVTGINPDLIQQLKKDFVNAINNPSKMRPPVYLSIEQLEIDKKQMLYIYVPQSSQVHKCNGKIYDRNQDGDMDITNNHQLVSTLYLNKQTFYTENRVYPYCELSDLRPDLIELARKRAKFEKSNHPWKDLGDLELLKSASLYHKDFQTGKQGVTLAGILLFGKDEIIRSVMPHYKTDLILRRENLDRYDDRDDVRTNLIESFDRITAFAQKHLPDPFYLEGTLRVSVRDKIMREIASNILIHREYTNAFPAKVIIEKNRIYAENGNKPHGHGMIDPENFTPYPKNPVLAGVFKEMGMADELGSGMRNLVKYVQIFSKSSPQLIEEDVFKVTIPLAGQETVDSYQVTDQDTDQVTEQVTEQ
ncbi:MAG: putative DNA binding domain-containing protein, partial [SAR324 cluster bacterium]|nr:putative DNA binding domain-containing protein [SAR324 cluster bacterium]